MTNIPKKNKQKGATDTDSTLRLPVCYEVDLDKVKTVEDVVAVLKAFPMLLYIYPEEYENHPIKKFLIEQKK